MKKYYGEYLIGKQSDLVAFATEFGLDITNDLMPVARRSVNQMNGEWIYLIELWDTDFHEIVRAWKHGLIPLKQWQASQLGIPIGQIKGKDGLPIIDNGNIIAGREIALYEWAFTLEPNMASDLTPNEILAFVQANNTKNKLIALFDAFEGEEPVT